MDRLIQCSQLAKKGVALLSSLLLAFALCMAFAPSTARADTVKADVAIKDCTVIGTYNLGDDEDPDLININYIALPEYAEYVVFTDVALSDMDPYGSITSLLSQTYYVEATNEAVIRADAAVTLAELRDHYGSDITFNEDLVASLDFSNAYSFFVMTSMDMETYEYDTYIFIVQVPEPPAPEGPFAPSVGAYTGPVANGYTYTDWYGTQHSVDLYTLTVPMGTQNLVLDFKNTPTLAYGYDASFTADGYICSGEEYGDGTTGKATASFSCDKNGELPPYIWVQTPYVVEDGNWSSDFLYAIKIEYNYTFEAYVNGYKLEVVSFEPNAYSYYDYMSHETSTVGKYTVAIPYGTDEVDFVFSENVLAYNYTADGEYLGGYYPGDTWMTGAPTATCPVDFEDPAKGADGEIDCIQVQGPYDAAWYSPLHYVVTFEYSREASWDIYDVLYATQDVVTGGILADGAEFGNEWFVMDLGRDLYNHPKEYYKSIYDMLEANDGVLTEEGAPASPTTYARTILALTATRFDPRDIAGYDLTAQLADYDAVAAQGQNALMWALIAFDSYGYDIPQAPAGKTQTTRDKLIAGILAAQLSDGGWDWMGGSADPDLTGMAIQSLAPYYNTNADVKAAVDRALDKLSAMQNPETGGFSSYGTENSCSAAQVITALTALKINPDTDPRFIKNGKTVVDALLTYADANGGFGWKDNKCDYGIGTYQSYYALISYMRCLNCETTLFDMTDVWNLWVSPVKTDGTQYHIISGFDNSFVLDVANQQPTEGSNVSIWTNNGGANQLFTVEFADNGNFVLRNVANPKLVLDAAGKIPEVGANVSTWTANDGYNQQWEFYEMPGDGGYLIINSAAGLMLDAAGQEPEIGANVGLWTYNGGANQKWYFVEANDLAGASVNATGMVRNIINGKATAPVVELSMNGGQSTLTEGKDYTLFYDDGQTLSSEVPTVPGLYVVTAKAADGSGFIGEAKVGVYNLSETPAGIEEDKTYRIVSASSADFILDVANRIPEKGSNVSIWTNNGGGNQKFTIEPSDDGYYVLRNFASENLVLDAAGDVPERGANVSTWTFKADQPALNQKWIFVPAGDGTYNIASAANPEFVLDAAGQEPEIGANVSLWTSNGGKNQQWSFVSGVDFAYAEVTASGMIRNTTGSALSPEIAVNMNGWDLEEGTNYTVKYNGSVDKPVAAGEYVVTIEAKAPFEGTYEVGTFYLHNAPIDKDSKLQYHLVSAFSDDFVLDVANQMPEKGSNVSIWNDNGGANQLFTLELGNDGYYVLRNVANPELVLDAAGDVPELGANVSTWTFKADQPALNQKWIMTGSTDNPGYFMIRSAANSEFVLDAAGDEPVKGANVSVWTAKESKNQLWRLSLEDPTATTSSQYYLAIPSADKL